MALTNNCDLFGAVHEDGINLIVRHIMRKRPSLFNYGTQAVADNPKLLCTPIDAAPEVGSKQNPLLTVENPLPLLGTNGQVLLNFCVQLVALQIDLHPEGVFELPPELSPPLGEQRFAIHARVSAGIACPSIEDLAILYVPTFGIKALGPIVVPTTKMACFHVDLFATGHFAIIALPSGQHLIGILDGLELVDIQPAALESSLECYLRLLVQFVVLPRMSIALQKLVLDLGNLATITLSASPISTAIPHNPAIEEDQLKVFIDMEVAP
jgi:hypothetical protein